MKEKLKKSAIYTVPSILIFAILFFSFFILRTCISITQFIEIVLIALFFNFMTYYLIAKKHQQWFAFPNINLAIFSFFTPILVVFILSLNYFVSTPYYVAQGKILDNVKRLDKGSLVLDFENKPTMLCLKLFRLQDGVILNEREIIRTQINKGCLGMYVLKFQRTYSSASEIKEKEN